MKYTLKVYCIHEFGRRKDADGNPHQEDSVYPKPSDLTDEARTFILCDGMGGHDCGEVASATVCETMGEAIANDGHDSEGLFTKEDFANALKDAFDALDAKDNGAEKKMGTTMTFLKLHNDGATIAHIGDSRVYHIRPGKTGEETKILFETQDHSLINDLVKVGELTKEEARLSRQKNVITRAMQPDMDRRPNADIHNTSDIKPGDYFYMCSDGMLEQPEMENGTSLKNIFSEQGGDDEQKVQILTTVTENNKDNHTAFIIHILGVEGVGPNTTVEHMAEVEDADPADYDLEDDLSDPLSSIKNKDNNKSIKGKGGIISIIVGLFVAIAIALCFILLKPDKETEVSPQVIESNEYEEVGVIDRSDKHDKRKGTERNSGRKERASSTSKDKRKNSSSGKTSVDSHGNGRPAKTSASQSVGDAPALSEESGAPSATQEQGVATETASSNNAKPKKKIDPNIIPALPNRQTEAVQSDCK